VATMSFFLSSNQYGKARVRVVRIDRQPDRHHIFEVSVGVYLGGAAFTESYVIGNNSLVVPTDTMKNTVYVVAKSDLKEGSPIESYGLALGKHFLINYSHIDTVTIDMKQQLWERMIDSKTGEPLKHSFVKRQGETRTATVVSHRGGSVSVQSGVVDLIVLKTTGSAFEGFPRCKYTTLAEAKDRVLSTAVRALWTYEEKAVLGGQIDYSGVWEGVRFIFMHRFANYFSPSVQQTLYQVGGEVITKFPNITEVSLKLPNIHIFEYDIKRFGLDNNHEVYFPVDDPAGMIEGTITRVTSKL